MEIYTSFGDLHPEIRFEFISTLKTVDLMAGEADIALRLTRRPEDPALIQRKVSTARYALYGSQAYKDRCGLPRSRDDLDGHCFVSFRRDDLHPYFDDWLRAQVRPDQIINTYSEISMMQAAVRSGRALGLDNVRLLENDPTMHQCFEPIAELDSQHLILITPEAYRRQEVKTFLRYFAPRYAAIFK